MKPELKQIETTLDKLEQNNLTTKGNSDTSKTPSFTITVDDLRDTQSRQDLKMPALPKVKPAKISSHNHSTNPALASSLLKDIEAIVEGWQKELQGVVRQIQDIYLEGPIVDGWLESHSRRAEEGSSSVRKAETDRLMDYVEELFDANITYETPRPGYRLCGLDESGQSWSKLCPPDEVPNVSVAIARYQKLRLLLSRKKELETRLGDLSETLVIMHSKLSE
ncbi:MAG: hypothetical protein WA999_17605 [Spirulinaceae cyanobacterium]